MSGSAAAAHPGRDRRRGRDGPQPLARPVQNAATAFVVGWIAVGGAASYHTLTKASTSARVLYVAMAVVALSATVLALRELVRRHIAAAGGLLIVSALWPTGFLIGVNAAAGAFGLFLIVTGRRAAALDRPPPAAPPPQDAPPPEAPGS